MSASYPTRDVQSIYDFWLRLIPSFLGQQSAQTLAQSLAPTSHPGIPNEFSQWAATAAPFAFGSPSDAMNAAKAATDAMLAPWNTMMTSIAGAFPGGATARANAPAAGWPVELPLQALSQSWTELANRFAESTSGQFAAAFDRTHGALFDALGLSSARPLQTAWQQMIAAGVAQQEARANYALLIQGAIAQGMQRLTVRLAEKSEKGERIDSVIALLRLWGVCTEEVMHETLQSESGLAATAALARSALAHRKRMKDVASNVADLFDIATRGELDEAYREIQMLKRELRASRRDRGVDIREPERARGRGQRRSARGPAKSRNERTAT